MKNIFHNVILRVSILIFAVFFILGFVSLRLKQNDLLSKNAELQEQIDRTTEHISELKAELDRPYDAEYVAEIAHEKLGLRYPQEIVYYSGERN